jgi:uncharacterized repeat protein (TIGR04138 family)
MPCFVCGKPRAEFHVNSASMSGGPQERRDYCEACFVTTFDGLPQMDELRAHARKLRENEIDDKIARDMQQLRTHLRPKLEELVAKNPRFSFESYEFIYASLTRAVHDMEPDPQTRGRHANAAELVRACQEQARHAWGDDARAHAKSLGFSSAADIRDIVFYLVENGSLGRRANDNRADFDGLSFLNSPSP